MASPLIGFKVNRMQRQVQFGREMLLRPELKPREDTESSPKGFNETFTEFIKG